MKNTITKIGVLLAMLLTVLSASAYDFKVDDLYYNVISLENMTCELASGDEKYSGDLIIPETVVYNGRQFSVIGIEYGVFISCRSLKSIVLPNSVTALRMRMFVGCSSLRSVTIPNSVTTIEYEVFSGCSSLETITIPNSVTAIGVRAFEGCSSLRSVTISNSVTTIENEVFSGCSSLRGVTIPHSVTSIRAKAFKGCKALRSVTIPNSVVTIEYEAFLGCRSLDSITIPNLVTTIESDVFSGCSSLRSITIPNSVTSIRANAFEGCIALKALTIPNSVTTIGSGVFQKCTSLESVALSDALVRIPTYTFWGCSSLKELNIPGSVIQLRQAVGKDGGNTTFRDCVNLRRLGLLYSEEALEVGYVSEGNFYWSEWTEWTETLTELYIDRPLKVNITVPNLEKLEIGEHMRTTSHIEGIAKLNKLNIIQSYAVEPPSLPEMSTTQYMNLNVLVPNESLEAYKGAPGWKNFWNISGFDASGIQKVNEAADAPMQVYSLSGVKVAESTENLPKGIYIVRQGDKARKIAVN